MQTIEGRSGGLIKAWVDGVEFEHAAQEQVHNLAGLDFIHEHVAIMPDVHMGRGASVGTVIPTKGAIIPAAVGVDLGCGMMAIRTSLRHDDLPDSLAALRSDIERAVPHGGIGAAGGWASRSGVPNGIMNRWMALEQAFNLICEKNDKAKFENAHSMGQLGSLGGGNHFIEICLGDDHRVWVMLHSGSRGVGNRIGTYFINEAKELLATRHKVHVPDKDLAWLDEGTDLFDRYVEAVGWAQDYALENRKAMMERVLNVMRKHLPPFGTDKNAVNCHHNYVNRERHFGEVVWVTRKGAVSARKDELGIIPGSMGARSYIVKGLGNADSFHSCSHGAGRRMSRTEAKRTFTVDDHVKATAGVECRKELDVIDETPGAYKDIDAVIAAQADLIEIVAILKQVLCVKG